MPDFADQLIAELDASTAWPLPRELVARASVAEGRALRKGDRDWLKRMHGWDLDRNYVPDSLARRIAGGWADFFFAEDVAITAAVPDDETREAEPDDGGAPVRAGDAPHEVAQAEIDRTSEINRMPARLHRAARIVISEGEAYWKLHVNRAVADCALLTWCSRLDVVPLFDGDRVLAAAFMTERCRRVETYRLGDEDPQEVIYRQAEIHTALRVVNVLYRGTCDELGSRVPLDSTPQTAGYAEEWAHGLPMLAGRVVNDLDDDDTLGVSEYAGGVSDMLLALNEAVTIGVENARLTGKDRIFAAGRFTQTDGSFDASLEVFQVESDGSTLGEGDATRPPVYAIEKKYDARELWTHITNLVKTILNRCGLVPQWVGEDVDGHGDSGLAVRLRFLPTTSAAKGKRREWTHEIAHIVDLQLQIAALSIADGGFGRPVAQDEPPAVEFADPIPSDESRDIMNVSAAVVSEVMSRRTAIRIVHPEWDDAQVDAELAEIDRDFRARELPPVPQPMDPAHPPMHA